MRHTKYIPLIVLTLFVTIGMAAQTGNRLYIDDIQMSANSQKLISVGMDNEEEIVAVEMTLQVPEGFSFNPQSFALSERSNDHQITAKKMGDNQYKIMILSTDNKPLKGIAGVLFTMMLENSLYEEGDYYISIFDAVMAIPTGKNVLDDIKDGCVTICSLPNLHVISLDCSDPVAGQEMTVKWKVRNDGHGSTKDTQWNDYIWLVPNVALGTSMEGSRLLTTVSNISSLESGEYYENSVNVKLDERVYGNNDLIVTSDMPVINNIDYSCTNGVPPIPYNPESESYGFLMGSTTKESVIVVEEGESDGKSDNFFYKRINIVVPPLPDIQVSSVVAVVDNDNTNPSPSPINSAGLTSSSAFYSGKNIKVTATIVNRGGADISRTLMESELYISSSPELGSGKNFLLSENSTEIEVNTGESTTISFYATIPYDWYGDTYFIVKADVGDAVYELANSANNSGVSNLINTLLTPGADFEPYDLMVPSQLSSSVPIDVSYSVRNVGPGVPFINSWIDNIYISSKNTGLDSSARKIGSYPHAGYYNQISDTYVYEGDNYKASHSIKVNDLQAGVYYIYVQVDAENSILEYDGEDNNIIMSHAIQLAHPDLTAEIVSVSEETLYTGSKVAVAWKLKNIGEADIQNVSITDGFWAAINANGSDGILLGNITNTISLVAGGEKVLHSNITIPKNDLLDGTCYLYVRTNKNNKLREANIQNNVSTAIKKQFVYVDDPAKTVVNGMNLTVSALQLASVVAPGESIPLSYRVKNTGSLTIDKEISQELFISKNDIFDSSAKLLPVTGSRPSLLGLMAGEEQLANVNVTIPNDMEGGKYYIYIVINRSKQLEEKKYDDNQLGFLVRINGNLPNLVVSDFIIPSTMMTSEKTEVSWTLGNTGIWDARDVTCMVYLSKDERLDNSDRLLAHVYSNFLSKNGTENMKATIQLADDVVGTYYLIVTAKTSDEEEITTEDNVLSHPFTSLQSPLPDLSISNLSSQGTWSGGQTVTIKAIVKNVGDSETRKDKWTDVFYLSEGYMLNTKTAIKLGSKTHVGKLEKNKSYDLSANIVIPDSVKGYYVLFVVADGTVSMIEKNRNNNQAKQTVFVEDPNNEPADLTITKMTVPLRITAGEPITITYHLVNQGEYAAKGKLRDVFYMSKDNLWDEHDTMVGVVTGDVEIEPGREITRSVMGRITNMPEGDYYLIVRTNSTHSIAESDYANNQKVQNSASTVAFQTLSLGSSVTVNTSGLFKLPLHSGLNGKTIGLYLSTPENTSAGLYTAYENVPSTARYERSASDVDAAEQEVLLSDVQEGNYYVLVLDNAAISKSLHEFLIDGEQQQEETMMTLSAREVPFGATSLSNTEGGTNGWISTEIHGALLDSIMDFRLAREGEIIPAESITFYDQTSSKASFNLHDAQTGSYDVISELPNGTKAIMQNGFKVVPGTNVALGVKLEAPGVVHVGSYAPLKVAYVNSGNTDIAICELLLVIDKGYLASTIEELKDKKSELHIKLDGGLDNRGMVIIPPGKQDVFNCYMEQQVGTSHLKLYIVK